MQAFYRKGPKSCKKYTRKIKIKQEKSESCGYFRGDFLDDDTVRRVHKAYEMGGISQALNRSFSGGAPTSLSSDQEKALISHVSAHFISSTSVMIVYVQEHFGVTYSRSGMISLLHRLGFEYKKPKLLPKAPSVAVQKAHISRYEALLNGLCVDEKVYFLDAVHPQHQSRPAFGWVKKCEKPAIKSIGYPKRLNLQGALCLEDFDLVFLEKKRIDSESTIELLQKIQDKNPLCRKMHVFLDNAKPHKTQAVRDFLQTKGKRIALHFLPTYAPNLNSIERLWKEMHKAVTYNKYYEKFQHFREKILHFLIETVPENWKTLRDQITDSFQIIDHTDFRVR